MNHIHVATYISGNMNVISREVTEQASLHESYMKPL